MHTQLRHTVISFLTTIAGIAVAVAVAVAGVGVAFAGLAAPPAQATTRSAGTSPGLPASTAAVRTEHSVRYCVTGYAPNRRVSLHNERGTTTGTVKVGYRGSGCARVRVASICDTDSPQTITATGTGADGNPATSSAAVALAPGSTLCGVASGTGRGDASAGDFSRGEVVALAIGGAALIGLVVVGVVALRRRRPPATG